MGIQSAFTETPSIDLTASMDLVPQELPPTQKKAVQSKSKLQEKADNLGIDLSKYQEPNTNRFSNLMDMAEASVYKTAGGIYDFGSLVDDRLGEAIGYDPGTKNETIDSWSEDAVANQMAGADPTRLNEALESAKTNLAQGNIMSAFGDTFGAAPELIASSAGSIATLPIGGGVTKVLGTAA